MEKEKLNKLNVKLEKELDQDIIEILDRDQNKTLFTKTAIRIAYQQMIEDPSIARVREPGIFKWDKFIQDINNNNFIASSNDAPNTEDTEDTEKQDNNIVNEGSSKENKQLDDEELF